VDADGNWSATANWNSAIVADGSGYSADFSAVNISANRTVTLDTSRNIGVLKFGDGSGAQNWIITNSNGGTLTLNNGASSPSIVVTNTATLALPVAGANGFTKSGPGTLVLSGTNSLSGNVFLDSGSTGGNGDGAVCVATSAALANASSLSIRNNTGSANGSTLQLDGTAGSVTLSALFTNSCRANVIPNVENLAGSNTLAGNIYMQTGGSNIVFQSDNGTLLLAGSLQYVGSLTSARTFNFTGGGNTLVAGTILYSSVAPLYLAKSGAGTLTLNGTNTYTGSTTINAGTLAGSGTIAGPVTVATGASLSPGGGAIGTLTVNNALTNNGTIIIRLNRSGAALTNDNIKGVSTLVLGGTLQLVSSGDPITVSNSFKIFSATNYRNYFTNIQPPTPGTNLLWNTNSLATSGTLAVALGNVAPLVRQASLVGTNLVLSGSGGAAGYNYSILSSTNLVAPLTNWTVSASGYCDGIGNFTVTNGLNPNRSQLFYVVRIP